MSEQEPQNTSEWETFANKKFEDIKTIIKRIESKGTNQSLEKNVRDAVKGFGDMLISLGGLAYGVASEVSEKATSESVGAIQKDVSKKADATRNVIADELDKVAKHIRANSGKTASEGESSEKTSNQSSDIT